MATQPDLRSFFKIGDMPYELHEHEVLQVVKQLLNHGASQIGIQRFIVDANYEPLEIAKNVEESA